MAVISELDASRSVNGIHRLHYRRPALSFALPDDMISRPNKDGNEQPKEKRNFVTYQQSYSSGLTYGTVSLQSMTSRVPSCHSTLTIVLVSVTTRSRTVTVPELSPSRPCSVEGLASRFLSNTRSPTRMACSARRRTRVSLDKSLPYQKRCGRLRVSASAEVN